MRQVNSSARLEVRSINIVGHEVGPAYSSLTHGQPLPDPPLIPRLQHAPANPTVSALSLHSRRYASIWPELLLSHLIVTS